MNTADKSISLLDVALRRRFAFVEFRPDANAFAEVPEWAETVGELKIGELLTCLNKRLRQEGIEIDRTIGHAILAVASDSPNPNCS